jgi:adenosylcobinamide-GDP ribazoletransferase
VRGLVAAVRYLTIVPVGGARPHDTGPAPGQAALWFPVVGVGIGLVLVVVDRVAAALFAPLLVALVTVTVWKLLTGGLHLDGLADCLDGLPGTDAEHRLRIMRDSRIGAFGAIGLILFLMLEIAALSEIPSTDRWRALVAAPVIARAMPALMSRVFPQARREGQGASFARTRSRWAVPLALGVALVVAVLTLRALGVVALAAAALVALALGRFFARRLGGITGDVLGAAVEAAELTTLLTVSAWSHAAAR